MLGNKRADSDHFRLELAEKEKVAAEAAATFEEHCAALLRG